MPSADLDAPRQHDVLNQVELLDEPLCCFDQVRSEPRQRVAVVGRRYVGIEREFKLNRGGGHVGVNDEHVNVQGAVVVNVRAASPQSAISGRHGDEAEHPHRERQHHDAADDNGEHGAQCLTPQSSGGAASCQRGAPQAR